MTMVSHTGPRAHLGPAGAHLHAEEGFRQAVATHDVGQIFQDAVEHLMQLLSEDGQSLLGRELPCERLGLWDIRTGHGQNRTED